MELLVAILLIFFVIYLYINKKKNIRSSPLKKSEIIENYKNQLKNLDSKEEKIIELKKINSELSRNIFFDSGEIKDVMNILTKDCI